MAVGVAEFQGKDVAVIAQQTPPSDQERGAYNYGLVQANGYGLALCMMRYAERYGLTLHTFIDTVGGDPFAPSATKLQSWLIARCQAKMINLQTRAMSTIIGQGGSGGAIALQLAHKRFMLALSMYAVISPEGCAAILFRQVNDDTIARALEVLQPTAEHMRQYGIVHEIIPEPALDDADYVRTVVHVRDALVRATAELDGRDMTTLQHTLKDEILLCGRIAAPKPWYKRGRKLTQRLWGLTQSATVTTDPHIASIRRHMFGNPDCIPQTCNPVREEGGTIVRDGCGKNFTAEEFRHNWQSCPSCFRPNPLDPATYVQLLLDTDSFRNLCASDARPYRWAGWTDLYDYPYDTRQRNKPRAKKPSSLAMAPCSTTCMWLWRSVTLPIWGLHGRRGRQKFRAIVQFAIDHTLPLLAVTTTGGARMQEGTVALWQMAKTTAAVHCCKQGCRISAC